MADVAILNDIVLALGLHLAGLLDSLLGTRFYEIIVIEMEEGVPTMRIRHFGKGLEPWDKEDEGAPWPLAELEDRRAVFRNADGSTITMDGSGEDGLDIEVNILKNRQGTKINFDLKRHEG